MSNNYLLFPSLSLYVSAILAHHCLRLYQKHINRHLLALMDVPPSDPGVDAAARVHPPLLGNAPAPIRFIMTRCLCAAESWPVPSGSTSLKLHSDPSPSVHTLFCAIEKILLYALQYFRFIVHRRSLLVSALLLCLLCQGRLGCVFPDCLLLLSHCGM